MKRHQFLFLISITLSQSILFAQGDHNALQLRVDPAYFSPNDDGNQDQTFFYPVLKSNVGVTRWMLDIFSAQKRKRVTRLSGAAIPALIKWDGLDKNGQSAPDGSYVAEITAFTRGKKLKAEQSFEIDQSPPEIGIILSTGSVDQQYLTTTPLVIQPRVIDSSAIAHWLVQVIDITGRTQFVYWSSGPIASVAWDGTGKTTKVWVPQGMYRVLFQAWDKAGNESAPVFADLQMNITAREMLGHALQQIQINETPLGLIVQMDANLIFETKRRKIVVSEQGQNLLREAAILINAYPDVSIKLDGYSTSPKKAAQDRDRSSIFAWRVYSFLTKAGNVKASRLMVRGRGRSAMFDRRSVGLPVLKNGVEIILEGNQW